MRRSLATLLLAIALGGATTPAAADAVLFRGVIGIEAATFACGILPYVEQGSLFKMVYKPAGLGTNGASTGLIIVPLAFSFTDLLVTSFTLADASLDNTFQEVDVAQATSSEGLAVSFEQYTARMRLLRQTPGDVDGADFLALSLQVRNFGNVAQCTVTFRGIISDKATPKL